MPDLSERWTTPCKSLGRRAKCPNQKVAWVLEWKLRILAGYQEYHHRGMWFVSDVPLSDRACGNAIQAI